MESRRINKAINIFNFVTKICLVVLNGIEIKSGELSTILTADNIQSYTRCTAHCATLHWELQGCSRFYKSFTHLAGMHTDEICQPVFAVQAE